MSILALLSTASAASTTSRTDTSWREERPFLGGVLLIVSGLIVGYVPLATDVLLLIKSGPAVTAIGLVFAVLIFLTGVFALLRPDQSTNLGIAGVVFSILSVVGGLGGLLVGLLIGILGSNLLISWEPPGSGRQEYAAGTAPSGPGSGAGWEESMGAGGSTAPTAASGSGQSFSWLDDHSTARMGSEESTQLDTTDDTGSPAGAGGAAYASDDTPTGTAGGSEPDFASGGGGEPDFASGGGAGGTGGADQGSTDFSWQEDPSASRGTTSDQEDLGPSFQAERESTMDEDEEEDEDDDDPIDFSWSED